MMLKIWDAPDGVQHLTFAPIDDRGPTHFLCDEACVGTMAVCDLDGVFTRVCKLCVIGAAESLRKWG